mgnify:CR=1 FL=1
MSRLRNLVMVSLISFISPAWSYASGLPHFPPESYNIEDFTVPGSATVQASLRMDSRYPESGVIDHYSAGVSHQWLACRSASPGWRLYIDDSSGKPKVVHQLIRYWVNKEDSKMLSIIVRHYSDDGSERCVPQSDVQHAVVAPDEIQTGSSSASAPVTFNLKVSNGNYAVLIFEDEDLNLVPSAGEATAVAQWEPPTSFMYGPEEFDFFFMEQENPDFNTMQALDVHLVHYGHPVSNLTDVCIGAVVCANFSDLF